MPEPALDPEDAKLVVLARSALGRGGGTSAAAVRDGMGRTYLACEVALASLRLTALQAAVAQAVGSGADSLEAGVVLSGSPSDVEGDPGLAAVAELGGAGTPVLLADLTGAVHRRLTAG